MKNAIAYYRVSTDWQGRSSLGLDAQDIQPGTPEFCVGMQAGIQELDQEFDVAWFMDDPRYQAIADQYGLRCNSLLTRAEWPQRD